LTIDDSPTDNTNFILDILKNYNIKATFFIIAGQVPGREQVMKRII
jgi:peptidoglycan/xylan/chitin deacetylase (PgdA/CDA1 family)